VRRLRFGREAAAIADELWFSSLGSCSTAGNSFFVQGPGPTRLLVDCGVRLRRLEDRLRALDVDPAGIDAVLISHEHTDHVNALRLVHPFAARHGIPVYAPDGFWRVSGHIARRLPGLCRRLEPESTVRLGGLGVTTLRKPHDAADPVAFVISGGQERLAVVTDLGHVPPALQAGLRDCTYYIFESNHDPGLERRSRRPWPLIRRVMGDLGHLSNQQAAAVLANLVGPATRSILLAHLSLDCNTPELAESVVGEALAARGFRGGLLAAPGPDAGPVCRGTGHTWID